MTKKNLRDTISTEVDIRWKIVYNERMKKASRKNISAKNLEKAAQFLKIISEENRLKILYLLKNGQKCVCEIWQALKLPQNLVSHHLGVLREFDLISSRKEGVKIFYTINKKTINKYLNLLTGLLK